ncbi:MAG TPA: alpha/beta fold hydrolase, partial [Pseudonocardia sp.]|nr:alpha/beta fold hydrolase [Pseudonocardia sp.]
GMGWSDRPSRPRRLAERIDDLGDLTAALGIEGPVVTVAHDWGGPISVGWALAHRAQLTGMVLFNTAVQHDPGTAAPGLIRLARSALLRESVCVRTPIFVRGAAALSRPRLPQPVRQGLAQPYPDAASRVAIGDFVADIPLEDDHPSRAALTAVADGLAELTDVPALLLWGPRDPVFTARHLADLRARMPQADVQRYPRASHLVTEDVPEAAEHVWRWVQERSTADPRPDGAARELDRLPWAAQQARRDDPSVAVAEVLDGQVDTTSFAELETRIADLAAGLRADGVRPGDRVALLIPPGVDLTVAVYACWRAGAVIVVADAGLGLRGLGHALRSAAPDHVIGIRRALLAVRALGVPGRLIPAGDQPGRVGEALGWRPSLAELARRGAGMPALPPPHQDAEAAVLFTSGATGPAKGVVYT